MEARANGGPSIGRRSVGAWLVVAAVLFGGAMGVLPAPAEAGAPVVQSPTDAVDASFASGGVLTAWFPSPPAMQEARDAAIQPDGKIVVLTSAWPYADYLSRYLPNGTPDTTFGTGGSIAAPAGSGFSALAIDSEGRIIVAGEEASSPWEAPDKSRKMDRARSIVSRFLPSGSPDPSFGTGGKTSISVPVPAGLTPGAASTLSTAVMAAPDGSITVGGDVGSVCAWESGGEAKWWEESGTFVARLDSDGAPESGFGGSGVISTHGRCKVEPGALGESLGALAQPTAESVLALVSHAEDDTWRFRTYSAAGALSEAQTPARSEPPEQVAVIGGGYLVLSTHYLYVGVDGTETLSRFSAPGTLDPTFGTNGRLSIPSLSCEFGPDCLTVLPDGRILLAGRVPGGEIGVERYLADGYRDKSFAAPTGLAWAELPGGNELDTVNKLLNLHGQPLVVGAEEVHSTYTGSQTALTLFQADGGSQPSFPPKPEERPLPPPNTEGPGGSGPGSAPTNAGAPYGAPTGSAPGAGTVQARVFTSAIEGALGRLLHSRNRSSMIASLLRTGVCRLAFTAPLPGRLSVRLTRAGSTAGQRLGAKPPVLASATSTFQSAGGGVLTLRLTVPGRAWLRGHRKSTVLAAATFTPAGGPSLTQRALYPHA